MSKVGGWFTGLSTGGKVAVIGGATLLGLGAVGATSPKPVPPSPVTKNVTEKHSIPCQTEYTEDPNLEKGKTREVRACTEGERITVWEVTYVDDKQTNRKMVSNDVTTQLVNQVVANGTYVAPAPQPAPAPRPSPNCDPNYTGGCVPNVSYDLDCPDIGFSVTVVGDDPHGFDRDGDGYGCESY